MASSRLNVLLAVIAGIVSFLIAVTIVISTVDFGRRFAGATLTIPAQFALQKADIEGMNAKIAVLRAELHETNKVITAPVPGSERTQQARQLQKIANDLQELKARQDRIEGAIIANPAKALEIPLLQRDVEALRVAQQANVSTVKESVDRIYDLNKWLFGGIAISIFSLAAGSLLRSKAESSTD